MKVWIDLLLFVQDKAGRIGGPGIADWAGKMLKASELDDRLHFFLGCLLGEGTNFPAEITSQEDIEERFSIYRSLRRASDTRALENEVADADIDVANRWKAVETAKGSRPGRSMRQHYAEPANLKRPFLRHAQAMWLDKVPVAQKKRDDACKIKLCVQNNSYDSYKLWHSVE